MCLSSVVQSFIPRIIGFGTLFQIQKLVGPIFKIKSNLKIRFGMKAYYGG
jgi:hypothetical protein